jgi:dynein heavy chain 1
MITPEIQTLIAKKRSEVYKCLEDGFGITWKNLPFSKYLEKFKQVIFQFEDQTLDIIEKNEEAQTILNELKTIDLDEEDKIKGVFSRLQSIINDFIFNQYSNIEYYVKSLNEKIELILKKRTEQIIEEWCDDFKYSFTSEKPKRHIK